MSIAVRNPENRLYVHLGAIAHNLTSLRSLLPRGVRVAGVVKADAYGHGMIPVARLLKEQGAEALAVAFLQEGVALRQAELPGTILVMVGPDPDQASLAVEHGLTPFVDSAESLKALSAAAKAGGGRAQCIIKVDTGMGRLGVWPRDALEFLRMAASLPGLEVTGLASHLATSGVPHSAYADKQAEIFAQLVAAARGEGFPLPDSCLAASGGVLVPPKAALGAPSLVRLGVALYGALPDDESVGRADLKGAMSFKTRLHSVRRVPAGTKVSYGCTWEAPTDIFLGSLPVGYSDGYLRSASNRAEVLVGGRRAPVRGRVCMNIIMIELAGFDSLPRPGDEVVLLGRQGDEEITLDELAGWAGTIGYEISCSLGAANQAVVEPASA